MDQSKTLRNVHACLVHEKPDIVLDLVRNLRCLDPDSVILLYNGGQDPDLLARFPFARYGAVIHPAPRPMAWGWLHDFALDCMAYALDYLDFAALTIVDSDQLCLRGGYSAYLCEYLREHPEVGLLGNAPEIQPPDSAIHPVVTAMEESARWRRWLRKLPGGEESWLRWTFWPSTVFSRAACRALVDLFRTDVHLQALLADTRIWASEEILFPTLVSALGFAVQRNPCSYQWVQYKQDYPEGEVNRALDCPDAFWMHPVPREARDPIRKRVRAHHREYRSPNTFPSALAPQTATHRFLLNRSEILARMEPIEGWLSPGEAHLLISATERVLNLPGGGEFIEVGAYCGRATVVLASVLAMRGRKQKVIAIDPHDGVLGARDTGFQHFKPSADRFRENVRRAGVAAQVHPHCGTAESYPAARPVGFLLIDGWHDYYSVVADLLHFAGKMAPGAVVAFHDYAPYFPGVMSLVDELLASGAYRQLGFVESLIVLEKLQYSPEAVEFTNQVGRTMAPG
ncbi:MAG: class I SAM-dependent methyltransferase [Bacteroidota bacterium]